MPRVSVIMPSYNAALYLREALNSVQRQTYRDWEVVLVDGGSTDGTIALAYECQESLGGRLRVLVRPKTGVAAARNVAILESSGEMLAFLDADDVWMPSRLERSLAALQLQPQVGLVHSRATRIDQESRALPPPGPLSRRYLEGSIATHLYTRRAHILLLTVTLRRACLDRVGLFDEETPMTEDRDLWFRIARQYPVAFLDEALASYRISPNSHSRNWERTRLGQLRFLEKHRQTGAVTARAYGQALANLQRERGDELFNRGEWKDAMRCYRNAVVHDPLNLPNLYMLFRGLAEPGINAVWSKQSL